MKGVIFTENIDMIMNGTKTQTRHVIKPKYSNTHIDWFTNKYGTRLCEIQNEDGTTHVRNPDGTTTHQLLAYMELAPRYRPGEIIYVKEAWGKVGYSNTPQYIAYLANGRTLEEIRREDIGFEWNKPMFMPEYAARIFLRVTAMRAEQLQDITAEDCIAEGVINEVCAACLKTDDCRPQREVDVFCGNDEQLVEQYANLWDKLNAKHNGGAFSWEKNPWVWVYTFERCKNES